MVKTRPLADAAAACYPLAMQTWVYEFGDLPRAPNQNGSRGASDAGVRYRAKLVRDARDDALAEILAQRRPPEPIAAATMVWTFYLPTKRRRDWTNLVGSAKPYEDALVQAGVLTDDNWQVVPDVAVRMRYRKGQPGFRIEITPTEG